MLTTWDPRTVTWQQPVQSGLALRSYRATDLHLPLACEYIVSLMNFIISSNENFIKKTSFHGINTRHKNDFHTPSTSLDRRYKLWHKDQSKHLVFLFAFFTQK